MRRIHSVMTDGTTLISPVRKVHARNFHISRNQSQSIMASTGRRRKTLQTLETLSRYQPDLNLEESDTHPEDQSHLRRSKRSKTIATHSSSSLDCDVTATATATATHTYTDAAAAAAATSAHIRSVTPVDDADNNSHSHQAKSTSDRAFEVQLNGLKKFKAMHGHCDVPKRYWNDDTCLGKWCSRMRAAYKKFKAGKKVTLINNDRIEVLEAIGFTWEKKTGGPKVKTFDLRLAELVEFRRAHGHCDVPYRMLSLGKWYQRMKKGLEAYQEGKGLTEGLTEERVQRLQEVGVEPMSTAVYLDL